MSKWVAWKEWVAVPFVLDAVGHFQLIDPAVIVHRPDQTPKEMSSGGALKKGRDTDKGIRAEAGMIVA